MVTNSSPKLMKAWLYIDATAGGLQNAMSLSDNAPIPSLPPDSSQVLLRVLSASTNCIDYKVPENPSFSRYMLGVKLEPPCTPAQDFSAVVVQTGSAVSHVKKGGVVMGRLDGPSKNGALATYMLADASGIVPVPAGLSLDDAAAAGTAALAAYQSVVLQLTGEDKERNTKKNKKVFINGASGGVGTYALQFAKGCGAHVVASCSGANRQLCLSLGANEVVDYTQADLVTQLKQLGHVFDLVVDAVGNRASLYRELKSTMHSGSKYVQLGGPFSFGLIPQVMINQLLPGFLGGGVGTFIFLSAINKREDWQQIAAWFEQGRLKSVVDSTFELEDAPKSYERQKSGRAKGKIIVHVSKQ